MGCGGLQNRCRATLVVLGGFDSHTPLPSIQGHRLIAATCRTYANADISVELDSHDDSHRSYIPLIATYRASDAQWQSVLRTSQRVSPCARQRLHASRG